MKTAGRITTTLVILLSLYLLGYWFLIKKDWADIWLGDRSLAPRTTKAYLAVYAVFAPIDKLDDYLNTVVPIRNYLTGHWRSDTPTDFVTFGPKEECDFRLGEFASKGKVEYSRTRLGYTMEFSGKDQRYLFIIALRYDPNDFGNPKGAHAYVVPSSRILTGKYTAYDTRLTKQPPNTPVP
jgi:hypothetical protein